MDRWQYFLVSLMRASVAVVFLLVALALAANLIGIFGGASTRSSISRVRSDMRSLKTALEWYWNDYGAFPPAVAPSDAHVAKAMKAAGLKSPKVVSNALTTPIAYLTSHFTDATLNRFPAPFHYHVGPRRALLMAAGRDEHYDIPLPSSADAVSDPVSLQHWFLNQTYDSTNGVASSGDVWTAVEVSSLEAGRTDE